MFMKYPVKIFKQCFSNNWVKFIKKKLRAIVIKLKKQTNKLY